VHQSDVKRQRGRDLPLPELGSKSMRRLERIQMHQVLRDDGNKRSDDARYAAPAFLIIERHDLAKSGPATQALFNDGSDLARVRSAVHRPGQRHCTETCDCRALASSRLAGVPSGHWAPLTTASS